MILSIRFMSVEPNLSYYARHCITAIYNTNHALKNNPGNAVHHRNNTYNAEAGKGSPISYLRLEWGKRRLQEDSGDEAHYRKENTCARANDNGAIVI